MKTNITFCLALAATAVAALWTAEVVRAGEAISRPITVHNQYYIPPAPVYNEAVSKAITISNAAAPPAVFNEAVSKAITITNSAAPPPSFNEAASKAITIHNQYYVPPAFTFNEALSRGITVYNVLGDCNTNGVADTTDISGGTSTDCNTNGTPDECETDCNTNGKPDVCDLAFGTASDCNSNGKPDPCDIAAGTSTDCNANARPDSCDIAGGTATDCNANALPDSCDIASGTATDCNSNAIPDACDLAQGTASDCNTNAILDSCDIASGTAADCNANALPDSCDIAGGTAADCNANATPDSCEIASGTASDCNSNAVPDSCELAAGTASDCNSNAILDSCDITAGTSRDCDANALPDSCQIAAGTSADCNANTVPDACDLGAGTSADCNADTVPDECQLTGNDCNTNGVPDVCELPGHDCNANNRLDACDLTGGTSADCNANTRPDECDLAGNDCNTNAVPDDCELAGNDCNSNGRLDSCDIAASTSRDCNTNALPDECELARNDCNTNAVPDACDLAGGTSEDCNTNHLVDECEAGQWIGPDGAYFDVPSNWSLGFVPITEALLRNSTSVDNRCLLPAGDTAPCSVIIEADGSGRQILFIGAGSRLNPSVGTSVNAGGEVQLQNGTLAGPRVDNAANTIRGYGEVTASVYSLGTIEGASGRTLSFDGSVFENRGTATLLAPIASTVLVKPITVHQSGYIEAQANASVVFGIALVNSAGGLIRLYNGALGAAGLTNDAGASIYGTGTLQTAVVNRGNIAAIADLLVVGNLQNDGTVIIQNGILTVTGTLSGSGTLIGGFGGRDGGDSGGDSPHGLKITGDLLLSSTAELHMPAGTLDLAGDFDVAIDSMSRYDLTAATLQMNGPQAEAPRRLDRPRSLDNAQTVELCAPDLGSRASLPDAALWSLDKLRIGPNQTTVQLVDNHTNSGAYVGREVLYVRRLILEPGTTLDLAGQTLYYGSVTPADPHAPGSGVQVIDTTGGGSLTRLIRRPRGISESPLPR